MSKFTQAVAKLMPRSWRGQESLFGSIDKTRFPIPINFDFYPVDGNGKVIDPSDTVGPQWMGLETPFMQMKAYLYCSPLASVIDRLAEADTNGKIQLVNDDGTVKTNFQYDQRLSRIMKLMKRPNSLQTWQEFNSQQVVLCKIFGYCPVLAVSPVGMDKSYVRAMWNINPIYCTPEINYDFNLLGEDTPENNPIKKWRFTIQGSQYDIDSSDILLVKDGFVDYLNPQIGLPVSKVQGLDYVISNICAAMEADNVLLKKKGPLGVFSHDPKPDMAGWQPLSPEQKDEIQQDLSKYGLSWDKLQYVVSKTPLKWNAMSFNIRDLMTKETVRQGTDFLCDRLGYPAELMSGKNATYENRNSAEKYFYQNNIIPFSIRRMERYDRFFDLESVNLRLNYDHLPVLQEDIQKASQARKFLSESITDDWLNNRITWNESRVLLKLPVVSGMDLYKHEYDKKFNLNQNEPSTSKDTGAEKK